ncbi:O-antigen ligase [Limnohabitans sp. JirII-31]|uniref:O-antigen ligase family protein n=1 Tax=Limnohabitans sp. JirII-31 TaxID=1977908 RepID=UPI000C1EB5A6|nr:O-antigen ligase family protein [Limnohabitans sp. JirII-31]PIT74719.1 hypothetical protein B9Z41_13270 [Limnohabitans sp. JirII-31]
MKLKNFDILIFIPVMLLLSSQTIGEHLYISHFILLILLLGAFFKALINRKLALPAVFTAWTLLFIASIIFSLWANSDFQALKYSSQILVFYCAVFFSFFRLTNYGEIRSLLHALSIGLGFNAIAGAIQTFIWIAENGFVLIAAGDWFRVKGLCGSPTDYVMQLIAGFFLSEFFSNRFVRSFVKTFYVVLLALSMSRSALLVLILTSIIYIFGLNFNRYRILSISAIISAIISAFILSDADPLILQRIMDIGDNDLNSRRFVVIDDVIQKSFSGFWVSMFGNGYGTYQFYNPIADEVFTNTHNIYLHILYSGGVIGLGSFLATFIVLFVYAMKFRIAMLRQPISSELQRFSFASLILFFSVLLIGNVETNIASVGTGWLVGMIFGIPLVIRRVSRQYYSVLKPEVAA